LILKISYGTNEKKNYNTNERNQLFLVAKHFSDNLIIIPFDIVWDIFSDPSDLLYKFKLEKQSIFHLDRTD